MDNDGATRRRGSVLRVSRLLERGKDKYKTRRSVDIDHERLREAAERSAGLHSIIPELDDHDVQRSSDDFRQAARDEAAAKLCGLAIAPDPPPPLPLVPIFPCALSSLSAHTQLSGPLLKHQTPNALARLVGTKAWKSRHAVFCTYALRNCSCAQPHRTSGPPCDSATRTLACLHVFATPTPDALELARLIVTEDSVVFVVEPTLAPDDSRRGPRDLNDRKCVFQVQGINGAPPTQPPNERISRRPLSRRRDSVGNGAPSFRSGMTGRPKTSLGLAANSSSANLGIGLDDDARVHAVWFLQCPDADARQRWVSCIKRAVLLQRAERAGFGGTVHFTSPRSVTDPLPVPSGDLDVVLAMRAQAHRGSTGPIQTHYASPPVTPMTSTFSPITPQFVPITPGSSSFATSPTGFTPSSATFSPISPGSETSHYVDAISLAFTRSQTPTYAPSVHTTHTAPALIPQSKSRNRSATVTNSAPVQALRGFFSGVSRPPSRSASVAVGKEAKDAREKRMRAASSATTAANPGHVYHNSREDAGEMVQCTHPYYQSLMHPLGTPISAGLGSMDLSSNERSEEGLGSGTPGMGTSALPGLGPNGLPTPGLAGLSILHAPSPTKPSNSVGVGKLGTSLPPPPRARRAGSVSHVLPGLASALAQHGKDDAMQRVQEEAMGRIVREGSGTVRGRSEDGRPSLVPMLSLSFGRGEEQDEGKENNPPGGRVLPPKLAPPSAPLPVPPGAPMGSRSSLALPTMGSAFNGLSVTTSPVLPGAWPSPMAHPMSDGPTSAVTASDAYLTAPHDTPTVSPQSPTSHSTPSAYSVPTVPSDALGGASYLNLSAHPDSTFDTSHLDLSETTPQPGSTPFTSEGPSASDSSQASVYSVQTTSTRGKFLGGLDALHESDVFRGPDISRASYRLGSRTSLDDTTHSRVSLALAPRVLHEYPEGDEWDGDSGRDYAHSGSGRDYSQSVSVRESPTRTGSYRASSPIAFMRDSPGPAERPRDRTGHFPRESFGSAFLAGDDVPAFSHPFSSASQSPSPSRRGHRRAGSYGGPTLFTISSSPLRRSRSQRSKPEKLPPAAPPPSFPLPPTPMGSRPTTPVSRPRTPVSRPRTPVSRPRTPGSIPPVPALPPPPRHTSLRTRLRILSTSSTPEPQPPRELPPPTEDELAQPISRVPIQLLVREDSTARRGSASKESYVGTSLPPPPRARPIRTQSYSDPEGRRSDSSVGEQ